MGLIKKIDVEKHFAERRAMRLGRLRPLSPLGAAGIKPGAKKERVPAAVKDLNPEPSSASGSSASASNPSDSGGNRLLRPPGIRQ